MRRLKGKENDASKKLNMYIAPRRPKTQKRSEDRELNQAKSKPDRVGAKVFSVTVATAECICSAPQE